MPLQTLTGFADAGIISDVPPYALPPNAFSSGNNVRFRNNGVQKIAGYAEVMATCPIVPYYLDSYTDIQGNKFFVVFGQNSIYVYSKADSAWYNVTPQATLQLNGAVTAGSTTIVVDSTTGLAPSANGFLAIGNQETGTSNEYEVVEYSSFTATDITLVSGLAYNHPDDAVVTPIEGTTTSDISLNSNTTNLKWGVTNLNGMLIANNGTEVPLKWNLTRSNSNPWGSGTNDPNKFVELINWPSSDDKCDSIRAYKTFLIGMGWTRKITPSGPLIKEPRLVKWSTGTATANEPVTWDAQDATLDAGEYPLTDTPGDIIDGLQLGEAFLIYKTDSIYVMNYVGTPYIFSFKLLTNDAGLISKNAVCAFEGGHFFIGNSDCYVTNGQTINAILPGRVRNEMFGDLEGSLFRQAYVVPDYVRNEIMACFPTASASYPNRALIWNYKNNTFSFRDLPDSLSISAGKFDITVGETWDGIDAKGTEWSEGTDIWTIASYDANKNNLLFTDATNTKIYRDNLGNKKDTALMSSRIERIGLDFGDPQSVKYVKAIYPQMDFQGNTPVIFHVGSQMSTNEGVTWEGPFTFDPSDTSKQSKISCRVSGKYISIKLESDSDVDWKLNGIGVDVDVRGIRGSGIR